MAPKAAGSQKCQKFQFQLTLELCRDTGNHMLRQKHFIFQSSNIFEAKKLNFTKILSEVWAQQ